MRHRRIVVNSRVFLPGRGLSNLKLRESLVQNLRLLEASLAKTFVSVLNMEEFRLFVIER